MSFSAPTHVPSSHASAKHNRSGKTNPRRRADDYYMTSDEDSDDLDRALAKIQACNASLRAAAHVAGGIPFPTAAVHHHARAPRDLPAQKPMPLPGAPLPLPPSDRNKPLPPSPAPRKRAESFNSTASYVGSEETGAPGPALSPELGQLRWAQYTAMVTSARASTDSLARSSPTLLYKGSCNSVEAHYERNRERNGLPPAAATRTFGEFLKTARHAGARVRKTSLDAYHAATDKAWELRVAAKYARKDVRKAAGALTRTVSRELLRGSGELRRVVSLSSRV